MSVDCVTSQAKYDELAPEKIYMLNCTVFVENARSRHRHLVISFTATCSLTTVGGDIKRQLSDCTARDQGCTRNKPLSNWRTLQPVMTA